MVGRTKLVAVGATALIVLGGVGVGGARVGSRSAEEAATRQAREKAALEDRLILLEKAQSGIAADREKLSGLDKQLGIMSKVLDKGASTVTVLGRSELESAQRSVKIRFQIKVRRAKAGDAIARVLSQGAAVGRAVRAAGATDAETYLDSGSLQRDCCGPGPQTFEVYGYVSATTRLTRVDRVVDAALKGRAGELEYVTFGFEPVLNAEARHDARSHAIAQAKEVAVEYARIAGRKLGAIVTVTEVAGPEVRSVLLQPATNGYREPNEMLVAVTYALI